ncbi:hypothetical protein evm_004832 [Chilo suppressalis]|nr:hypothetical protein evm_004832 [Chilo suppressalis]
MFGVRHWNGIIPNKQIWDFSGTMQKNSSTVESAQVPCTSYAVPKTQDKKLKRKHEDESCHVTSRTCTTSNRIISRT